ncbi:MAG: sulfite exporter TauE/SafE family protein [Clostridia bacterium]|nr:sulfite exporter TauE/SafE family protein [Clostridia bacterium]
MKTLTKLSTKTLFKTVFLAFLATLAGIVNGFLGTGGGIVLMFALSMLPTEDDNAVRDRFATLIAVILPLSLISVISYGDSIDFSAATPYLLPGMLGGVVGALLLDRLNVKIVKKLFAAMVIWAGISFLR